MDERDLDALVARLRDDFDIGADLLILAADAIAALRARAERADKFMDAVYRAYGPFTDDADLKAMLADDPAYHAAIRALPGESP